MNDIINQNPWLSPVQQGTCPNCPPPFMPPPSAAQSDMFPFSAAPSQTVPQSNMTRQIPRTPEQPNPPRPIVNTFPGSAQSGFLSPSALMPPSTSNVGDMGMLPQLPTTVDGNSPNVLPGLTAINLFNQPAAVNVESLQYLNGFMLTQIGRMVSVEFLIGTSTMMTKNGRLVGVGANYILINEFESDDVIACDFYSIKFIRFYY